MKLFKGGLGLTINQKGAPDPEFLVRLVTPYSSHNAMLRAKIGNQFKNLDNYLRSRHESSLTTLNLLCQSLDINLDALEGLRHGKDDGPLLPEILEIFYWIEGFYQKVYGALTCGEVHCPHCNLNIMEDSEAWWGKQNLVIERPEYLFLERILSVIVGGTFIYNFLGISSKDSKIIKASSLSTMNHRPIGNWLALVVQAYDCSNLKELAAHLQVKGIDISHELLKKWSSEQILIPFADANKMIEDLPNKAELFTMLLISRALAFSIDFLRSSIGGTSYIQYSIAQKVILERIQQLEHKILIMFEFRSNRAKVSKG